MGLYEKALLLADTELTFRTAVALSAADDAFLVEDPVFTVNTQILDRNNVKTHLSQDPGVAGRKIAQLTFRHEVRSNGTTDGSDGNGPLLGRLLGACGMELTRIEAGTDTILDGGDDGGGNFYPTEVNSPTGSFTFTKTAAYTGTLPRVVALEVVAIAGTGDGSGSNGVTFDVDSPAVGDQAVYDATTASIEDGDVVTLPDSATITVTIGDACAVGDTFIVNLTPPGYVYTPVSTGFESLTMEVYYDAQDAGTNPDQLTHDSVKHQMVGARGTFTMEAVAADYARFNFTFTGDYVDPVDVAFPSPVTYEPTIPSQVELSNLTAGAGPNGAPPNVAQSHVDFDLCAQQFSFDIGNAVTPRECVNGAQSYEGALITDRAPSAGFNPETVLEYTHPFWGNVSTARRVAFSARVGSEQGNVVTFWAPYAQYSTLPYGNRNGTRTYEIDMRLNTDVDNGGDGNDELRIIFS